MIRAVLFLSIFLASVLTAFMSQPFAFAQEAKLADAAAASDIWQKMTDEATHDSAGNPLKIQPGCEPTHLIPPAGVPVIGTAILIHGYTGCPQQYFELSELLTAGGLEVYLPLSPGHGRVLDSDGEEDLHGMPGRYDLKRYKKFAHEINDLAAASDGVRILGGLSGGGSIATQAMNTAIVPYDRVILMSPWYHAHVDFLEGMVLDIEQILPLGFGQTVKWGEGCLSERAHGRVGYCQSSYSNLAGAETLGEHALKKLKPQSETQIQVVAVENDGTVSVDAIVQAIGQMGLSATNVCFMPSGIPHSFFSPFDNIDDNPVWIPPFEKNFAEFALKGTPFPQTQPSVVTGFKQCPAH
jgi:pimeloyl-ACP methyl ester carboxylesterase